MNNVLARINRKICHLCKIGIMNKNILLDVPTKHVKNKCLVQRQVLENRNNNFNAFKTKSCIKTFCKILLVKLK